MACKKTYYTKDKKESQLFNSLRDRYGENRAEEVYLSVHTDEFKAWFGDWENSKNHSLGVDENGEPQVFWLNVDDVVSNHHNQLKGGFPHVVNVGNKNVDDAYAIYLEQAITGEAFIKESVDPNYEASMPGRSPGERYPVFLNLRRGRGKTIIDDGSGMGRYRPEGDYEKIVHASGESGPSLRDMTEKNFFANEVTYRIQGFQAKELIKGVFPNPYYSAITTETYKSKVAPEEMVQNLRDSSSKITAPTKDGKTGYVIGGKALTRVSTVVDRKVPYGRGNQETGKHYADEGTRYHEIAQQMIEGATDATLITNFGIEQKEYGFLNTMRLIIDNLRNEGGFLMSEVRVASSEADRGNGIAGTLDIIHIRRDGFVDVYDIKTANETEWKRDQSKEKGISKKPFDISDYEWYKAERYTHQTMLYAKLLGVADEVTNRRSLSVRNVYVIPVEIFRNPDDSVRGLNVLEPQNIKTWKVGKRQFSREAEKWADSVIKGTTPKSKISGLNYASTVNTWLPQALGIEIEDRDIEKSAIRYVENYWAVKKPHINGKAFDWVSENKGERVQQLKDIMESTDEGADDRLSNQIRLFFDGHFGGVFQDGNEGTSLPGQRLAKIISSARAESVTKLASISGFEDYDDITLLERPDGSYDMLKMTYEPLDKRFSISNTENKNIIRGLTGTATQSILGNHITPINSREAKVTMENTMGDYHRMRMGLIAMEFVKANPEFKINRIILDQLQSESDVSSRAIPAHEVVDHIKKLYNIPAVKPLASGQLKELLEDETSYNFLSYKGNPTEELIDYMSNELQDRDFSYDSGKPNARAKIQALLNQYKNNELTKDNLSDELINNVSGLREVLRRTKYVAADKAEEKISSDPEFMLLAQAILDLKAITLTPESDISNEFFGFISKYLKTPIATGRQTADKAYDMFRQFHDDVKREVQAYNAKKQPYVNELIRESPMLKRGFAMGNTNVGGSDVLFGMGQSVFDRLIQTKTNADGITYRLPYLIAEGSEQWKELNDAERKFIRFFNETTKSYNKNWGPGMLPLLRVSPNTLLYRGKKDIAGLKISKAGRDGYDAVETALKNAASHSNYELDESQGIAKMDKKNDYFGGLIVGDTGNFKSTILAKYGLDEGLNLIDAKLNEGFETNLEVVLTRYVADNAKKKSYDKALPVYHVMRSILKTYEIAYGLEQKDTIEALDFYMKDLVFNTKQAEDKIITQWVNIGVQTSSVALLGLNPKVFVANAIQMWSGGLINSLTNSITNDPRFPGVKAFGEAAIIMMKATNPSDDYKTSALLNLLKNTYLPDDLSVLTGKRNQKTASGMIDNQMAFAIDRMTEYTIRTQHLIAQMIKDGSYHAHEAVQVQDADGFYRWKLVYDPKKDKRFEGKEGKMLYDAIKLAQDEKGELDDKGEITMAYDWKLRNRLHAYINRQIGAFDRDLGSHYNRFALMNSLSQFRSWFRDMFVRSTKLEYQNEAFGNYVNVGDKMVWEKDTMKGIMWTLADMPTIVHKIMKKEKLADADVRNLVYSINSLMAVGLAMALVAALWDDEDDVPAPIQGQLTRYYSDVMSFITLSPFASVTVSPVVFISYYNRLFQTVGRAVTYGFQGDSEKMSNAFQSAVPVFNQFPVNEE